MPECAWDRGEVCRDDACRSGCRHCPHDSLSGDEGPVAELGRMPTRWRCDECGAIVSDDDKELRNAAEPKEAMR